jgi:hypothetical protein
MAEFYIAAGAFLIFLSLCIFMLWLDTRDIEERRARGEDIEPPSMWP